MQWALIFYILLASQRGVQASANLKSLHDITAKICAAVSLSHCEP